MVAILLVFKIVTVTLIYVTTQTSVAAIPLLLAMNWPWLLVIGLLFSVIPFAFWARLVRARWRRRRLLQAEWRAD